MSQPLPSSGTIASSIENNTYSPGSLALYTLPVGGQAFAVQSDGAVLMACRVPPEIDDIPLWLLSVRERSGKISSFSPIKGDPIYFSTDAVLTLASSRGAREWHQGIPPDGTAKITRPLKEEQYTTLVAKEAEEVSTSDEKVSETFRVSESASSSSPQATSSPVDWERQQREKANQAQIDRLANARATDIQRITATQLTLDNNYCQEALQQGQKSFQFAVKFAPWGIGFIAISTLLLIILAFFGRISLSTAIVNVIGSLLIEGLPGVGFFLYYQASRQFKEFSRRIDLRNRYLLANSIIITSLEGQEKQQALLKLIDNILRGEAPEILPDEGQEKPQHGVSLRKLSPAAK